MLDAGDIKIIKTFSMPFRNLKTSGGEIAFYFDRSFQTYCSKCGKRGNNPCLTKSQKSIYRPGV